MRYLGDSQRAGHPSGAGGVDGDGKGVLEGALADLGAVVRGWKVTRVVQDGP